MEGVKATYWPLVLIKIIYLFLISRWQLNLKFVTNNGCNWNRVPATKRRQDQIEKGPFCSTKMYKLSTTTTNSATITTGIIKLLSISNEHFYVHVVIYIKHRQNMVNSSSQLEDKRPTGHWLLATGHFADNFYSTKTCQRLGQEILEKD